MVRVTIYNKKSGLDKSRMIRLRNFINHDFPKTSATMTSITPFRATDLLSLSAVNLDVLTENYFIGFYLGYLSEWPSMFFKSENQDGVCTGYMMGKAEGRNKNWHSHITAVTVSYDYRRIGLAKTLVEQFVTSSEDPAYDCYFMDLFVRSTNALAINMYRGFGFDIFQRVVGYYDERNGSPPEDAFGMLLNLCENLGQLI